MAKHQSKIEKLIEELCPDGVEYVKLQEVAEIGTGSSNTNEGLESGLYPFFVRSPIVRFSNSYEFDEIAIITSGDGVGVGKIFHFIEGKYSLHQRSYRIHFTNNNIYPKYFFYFMKNNFYNYIQGNAVHSSVTSIRRHMLDNYTFPVPPMEVQEEIVKILDKFTQLEAELEAELEARKKQYDHYKKNLLTTIEDTLELSLGELFDMKAGKSIQSEDISINKTNDFIIPCFGGNGLRGYVKQPSHSGKYVLIGRQGALCGNVKRVEGEFYATEHAVVVKEKYDVNIDWAFHFLNYLDLNKYATISAQPGLSVGKIETIPVKIPPKPRQEQIAKILDKFEALVNDISVGLPAELAARRKQYEYYRNKLLTFGEKDGRK